jgi:hypothetical protein
MKFYTLLSYYLYASTGKALYAKIVDTLVTSVGIRRNSIPGLCSVHNIYRNRLAPAKLGKHGNGD